MIAEEAVDRALYGAYRMQLREELIPFVAFVKKQNPKTFIEIGYGRGETLDALTRVLPNTNFLEITFPYMDWTWKEGLLISLFKKLPSFVVRPLLPLLKRKLHGIYIFTKIRHDPQYKNVVMMFADSHKEPSFKRAINWFGKTDFLFIDGDHSYDGVKADWELFKNIVNEDGYIAFHDVVGNTTPGVVKFWNEIQKRNEVVKIISAKKDPKGFGIIKWRGNNVQNGNGKGD
jgi:hypothetical protein